ncbi:MAG: twin-arginine translocation signal domain-containing protein, partial [Sedimentisphaerales bacterium]|nr:twin-arginine translocation signal domain-containing protein [Sedimentisphaerales bacterium]
MQSIQDQPQSNINKTRRSFLKQATAIAGLAAFMPRLSLGNSANGRLQHASIGVGGMGWSDLNSILNGG